MLPTAKFERVAECLMDWDNGVVCISIDFKTVDDLTFARNLLEMDQQGKIQLLSEFYGPGATPVQELLQRTIANPENPQLSGELPREIYFTVTNRQTGWAKEFLWLAPMISAIALMIRPKSPTSDGPLLSKDKKGLYIVHFDSEAEKGLLGGYFVWGFVHGAGGLRIMTGDGPFCWDTRGATQEWSAVEQQMRSDPSFRMCFYTLPDIVRFMVYQDITNKIYPTEKTE